MTDSPVASRAGHVVVEDRAVRHLRRRFAAGVTPAVTLAVPRIQFRILTPDPPNDAAALFLRRPPRHAEAGGQRNSATSRSAGIITRTAHHASPATDGAGRDAGGRTLSAAQTFPAGEVSYHSLITLLI